MILDNKTSVSLKCTIGENSYTLMPNSQINIYLDFESVSIRIYHSYSSCKKHLFDMNDLFYVVIDSEIEVDEISRDSMIIISGEIVHFALGYVYDKLFFAAEQCKILSENITVSDVELLQQYALQKKKKDSFVERISTFFLSGVFISSTCLFIILKLAFSTNGWAFYWWLIFLFWVVGFVFQIIGEKIVYLILSNKQPMLSELNKYISVLYIMNYFYNPKRTWISDDRYSL